VVNAESCPSTIRLEEPQEPALVRLSALRRRSSPADASETSLGARAPSPEKRIGEAGAAGPGPGLSFPAAVAPTIATMVPTRSAALSMQFRAAAEAILAQAGTLQRKVSQPAWLAIPAACSWSSKCACESSPRTGSCNVRTLGT
jgi:hypothetical protein